MSYIETFQIKECDKIVIESYKKLSDARDGKQARLVEIVDSAVIEQVLFLLRQLPDKGDMMIKMGNVPLLKVKLCAAGKVHYFEFFGKKMKTPDTSFYSDSPPQVMRLYDLLTARQGE